MNLSPDARMNFRAPGIERLARSAREELRRWDDVMGFPELGTGGEPGLVLALVGVPDTDTTFELEFRFEIGAAGASFLQASAPRLGTAGNEEAVLTLCPAAQAILERGWVVADQVGTISYRCCLRLESSSLPVNPFHDIVREAMSVARIVTLAEGNEL